MKYGIKPEKGMWSSWSGYKYQAFIKKKLRSYLKSKRIDNKEKLEMLIIRLSKKIDESKAVIYFIPGLFFGFMIPSWAAYNSIILFRDKSFEEAVVLLLGIFICLVIIAFLLGMIKNMSEDILSLRRQRLIQLLNLLQDIQFEYVLEEDSTNRRTRQQKWKT